MKPKLLAIALLFGMLTTAAAHADVYADGAFTATGYSLDETEAGLNAILAMNAFVDAYALALPPGESVIGITVGEWSYDGFEYTIKYLIWIDDGGPGA